MRCPASCVEGAVDARRLGVGPGAGGGSLSTQRNFFCPLGKDDRCPLALGELELRRFLLKSPFARPQSGGRWRSRASGACCLLPIFELWRCFKSSHARASHPIFHTVTLSEFLPDETTHRSGWKTGARDERVMRCNIELGNISERSVDANSLP